MRRRMAVHGSWVWGVLGMVALMLLCGEERTEAIPAFARQLDAKCNLCHTPLPPRLNNVGLAFRRMGLRLPDTDEAGNLIFRPLPARNPFDTTSFITDFRYRDERGRPSRFDLHEFEVFSGGNLGRHASYIVEWEWEEEWEWDMSEGQLNVGKPTSSFILRAGRIAPLLWEKGNHQRLTLSRPLVFHQRVRAGSFPGFRLRDTLIGIELGGAWNRLTEGGQVRSLFASVSAFNGIDPEGEPALSDIDQSKDIMAQVVYLWGESNTVGALWYRGTGLGEDDPATPADESSRDRFNRFAVFGNWRMKGGTDFLLGWMRGRENSRGPGGVGKVSSRGFFVEVNQAFGEKVVGVFRWDDFDPNTDVGGNTRRGWTVGFVYQPHDNLFLRLEYQGHKTGAAPRTRDITLQLQVVY